jgi:multiple sugar transport system permease protein
VLTGANLHALANSLVLSLGAALLTLLLAAPAAYPLSRYGQRSGRPILVGLLFATGLPITAIMVPVYGLFVQLNLLDSIPATTLFLTATGLPIAIWMMKNFMDDVPISLEEAAWVDVASGPRALLRIVLPLMVPGTAVVFTFTFALTWGNFFVPFILLLDPNKAPASVAIYQYFGAEGMTSYGLLAAFSILYSLPIVVLYSVIQRVLETPSPCRAPSRDAARRDEDYKFVLAEVDYLKPYWDVFPEDRPQRGLRRRLPARRGRRRSAFGMDARRVRP